MLGESENVVDITLPFLFTKLAALTPPFPSARSSLSLSSDLANFRISAIYPTRHHGFFLRKESGKKKKKKYGTHRLVIYIQSEKKMVRQDHLIYQNTKEIKSDIGKWWSRRCESIGCW
jgi:hypothetical protein